MHDALLSPATTYPTRDTKKQTPASHPEPERTHHPTSDRIHHQKCVRCHYGMKLSSQVFVSLGFTMLWDEEAVDECADTARARCTDLDGCSQCSTLRSNRRLRSSTVSRESSDRRQAHPQVETLDHGTGKTATELQLHGEKC